MSDYIRREDAKNLRFSDGINHDGFLYVPYKELVDGIKTLPSADVVQVVRCKDCKWFRRWIDTDIEFCDLTESTVFGDDFCSRGERNE